MTTEKSDKVTIPVWVITIIVSLLVAGFTSWGVASQKKAETETRLKVVEQSVDKKVDKELFNMVVEKLNSIEAKVDKLREER